MVKEGFWEQGIIFEDCYLEFSFYVEIYGLQGCFDLLYFGVDWVSIVELKSGKFFMFNIYGFSVNYYIQILFYDLMVCLAFGKFVDFVNYIFYFGQDDC